MDWWTFGSADAWCHASVASTWFGLRHARLLSCTPSTHSGFEIWVLHFWVLVIFESWLLRFPVLGAPFPSFGCFAFEIWVLRFRDLGASCFGLRFRALRFQNYRWNVCCFVKYNRWFCAFGTPGGSYMDALPVAHAFRVTWSERRPFVYLFNHGSISRNFFRHFSSLLLLLIVSFSNLAIVLNYIWY